MQLLGIEMPFEEFDALLKAQSKGKELKVVDGKVVAVDHEITQEEIKQQRIGEIQARLEQLSQDFIQSQVGAEFNDLEERKAEFRSLHNELRTLFGKEPRIYN